MELATKLAVLADAAKYDASCASSGTSKRNSRAGGLGSTTGALIGALLVGLMANYTGFLVPKAALLEAQGVAKLPGAIG